LHEIVFDHTRLFSSHLFILFLEAEILQKLSSAILVRGDKNEGCFSLKFRIQL